MRISIKRPKPFSLLVAFHAITILLALAVLWRQDGEKPGGRNTVAVLSVDGIITMERGGLARGGSVDDIVSAIDRLSKRPDVKALVLKINSPGGSVGAVQAIHQSILRFRKSGRRVVSSFGDVAASGGYYIACAGDKIVSQPGTLTGSIGVVMQLPNVTGLMQKVGLRMETVTSGAMKDAGSPFRAMTPAEEAHFKALVNDAYDQFFEAVRAGRGMTADALRPVADGRVMSGRMALKAKLIDQLGGAADAVELAKEIAGLEDTDAQVVEEKEKPTLERLIAMFARSPADRFFAAADTGARLMYLMN